jgi:hypothetical protein
MSDIMPSRLLDPAAVAAYIANGQCAVCCWPDVCEIDRTCWKLEPFLRDLWPVKRQARPEHHLRGRNT